ncbi:hypothetical protein D3C72_2342380 [compost metagenome]
MPARFSLPTMPAVSSSMRRDATRAILASGNELSSACNGETMYTKISAKPVITRVWFGTSAASTNSTRPMKP